MENCFFGGTYSLLFRASIRRDAQPRKRSIAAAAARKLDVPMESIRDGLRESRLKPHRLEAVAEREGVLYVDDSKATNPAAVASALESFERR